MGKQRCALEPPCPRSKPGARRRGEGHSPTYSEPTGTLARPHTPAPRPPHRAVLGVGPPPSRSHGEAARVGTPRSLLTSPAACRGHGGREGVLASGSVRRRLRRSRSFHSNPRGRAPCVRLSPAAPPSARAPRALPGLQRRRRGSRGAAGRGVTLRWGEARLGASPSKEKATPGRSRAGASHRVPASPPPRLPASRLKEVRASSQNALREARAGAVPACPSD